MFPGGLRVPSDETTTRIGRGALITFVNYIFVYVIVLFSNMKEVQYIYNVLDEWKSSSSATLHEVGEKRSIVMKGRFSPFSDEWSSAKKKNQYSP